MVRGTAAQDRQLHGPGVIAIKECSNGYNYPVYHLDDPWLNDDERREIRSWEVK